MVGRRDKTRNQLLDAVIMVIISVCLCVTIDSGYNQNKDSIVDVEADATQSDALEIKESIPDDLYIVMCSGYVNLRSSPSSENGYNVIGSIYSLTPCALEDKNDGWCYIRIADKKGYVQDKYLVKANDENLAQCKIFTGLAKKDIFEYDAPRLSLSDILVPGLEPEKDENGHVERYRHIEGDKLNKFYFKPREYSNTLGIITTGSRLSLMSYDDDWYMLINESNDYTFVKRSSVEITGERYREVDAPKKKASFMSEFSNFGVYVGDTTIEVKEQQDLGSKSLGILPPSCGVDILSESDEWYEISSGLLHGYIPKGHVLTGDEAKVYGENHSSLKAFTSSEIQSVYTEPSRLGKVWTRTGKNQVYDVLNRDGYWVEIDLGSGDETETPDRAYMSIDDGTVSIKYSLNVGIPYLNLMGNQDAPKEVITKTEENLRLDIIGYACQFIGNPYVWGGTSLTNGADCSGFCQSVLRKYNIYIPRVSRDQAKVGLPVESPDQLKPGDLIFYANSSGIVNHVAMYIGNGMIVNAGSAKSGICINTYNYRTPVAMRNVIGNR